MNHLFSLGAPEAAVLLAAARQERVCDVPAGIDWDLLIEGAEREGMAGLVEIALRSTAVPDEIRRKLNHRTFLQHARALTMLVELRRVMAAFEAADIPILTFKGAILGQQLYDDPGARIFGDLDVIVAPADADRGEVLLRELGYSTADELTPELLRLHRRFNSESAFYHRQTKVVVDYHWSFTNVQFRFDLDFAEAWAAHAQVLVDADSYPTLGLHHLILLTCSHAAKHRWSSLENLASIAALSKLTVDWSAVEEEATDRRVLRQLGLSFLLVEKLLHATVPDLPLAYAAARPHLDAVAKWPQEMLFALGRRDTDAGGRDLFLLLDRRTDVYRALATAVFAPTFTDWRTASLPSPLYWLLRPARLVVKYLRR